MKIARVNLQIIFVSLILLTGSNGFCQMDQTTQVDDWEFVVAPYLFMASVSGDVALGDRVSGEVDLNFGDILEKLQFAFMIHGEAYKGDWGLIVDYTYLKLGEDFSTDIEVSGDVTFKESIFEAFVSRKFRKQWGWFDVYGGIRYWDLGLNVNLQGLEVTRVSRDQDWVDPVIGGRVYYNASERFIVGLRADIGGFGLGSDFAFNLQPGVGYQFSELFILMLQYKYLYTKYDNDTSGINFFSYDASTNGPLLGLVFRF